MLFTFYFGKKARFVFPESSDPPESNDPPKVATSKGC